MRNIKARYIWISVAVAFLAAIGLIIGVTYTKGNMTTFVIVLIAIVFIYMTIAIQIASAKTFRYKAKKIVYPKRNYSFSVEDFDSLLKQKGYKPRTTPYGMSYLRVDALNAYKVVLIKNAQKYFNPEENEQASSPNKSLEKCQKFIGFEIFLDYDEETLNKLPDFNIQGNNIYYSGLYKQEKQLCCPNYIEPKEEFINLYQSILEDLELKTIEEQN
ncbi:MAG: hypothetical protein K2I42_02360 [Anaeroplasmataceae bacterium]|nr:hypothetical protein [Anaeroplasmataceae bacterium]